MIILAKSTVISVSGKGGVGKTTIAALILKNLMLTNNRSILVVDADPATNLPDLLDVPVTKTVGMVTDEMKKGISKGTISATVSKESMLEAKIFEILAETSDFDLLAMGRSEGEGCYCMVNHMLTKVVDSLSKNYDITLMDMEAGLEHLSRRTERDVDVMLIVTDQSRMGLQTAKRIQEIADEVHISFKKMYLVGNRFNEQSSSVFTEAAEKIGFEFIGSIPEDPLVSKYNIQGTSLLKLPEDSPSLKKMSELMKRIDLI